MSMNRSDIHANDVLFGRGGFTNTHNVNFRLFVESSTQTGYHALPVRQRLDLVTTIVRTVRDLVPRGRFLENRGGLWFEVTDHEKIIKKVMILLRNGKPDEVPKRAKRRTICCSNADLVTPLPNGREADNRNEGVVDVNINAHGGSQQRYSFHGAGNRISRQTQGRDETTSSNSETVQQEIALPRDQRLRVVQNSGDISTDSDIASQRLLHITRCGTNKGDQSHVVPQAIVDAFLELHDEIRCLKRRVLALEQENDQAGAFASH